MKTRDEMLEILDSAAARKPVKLGRKKKILKCGMCGVKVDRLYPRKVGQKDFMICARCKAIMDF